MKDTPFDISITVLQCIHKSAQLAAVYPESKGNFFPRNTIFSCFIFALGQEYPFLRRTERKPKVVFSENIVYSGRAGVKQLKISLRGKKLPLDALLSLYSYASKSNYCSATFL